MPHGSKILGQAGTALADIYDVDGSVVHVDEIDASQVQGVHELGSTINSERMGSSIIRLATGDILQTIDFNVLLPATDLPGITRILGVMVMADADRVLNVQLSVGGAGALGEVVLFAWDATTDAAPISQRINVLGTVAGMFVFRPISPTGNVPGMMFGPGQRAQVPILALRGTSTTFGAGNVDVTALIQVANADVTGTGTGAPSNIGLPLASW